MEERRGRGVGKADAERRGRPRLKDAPACSTTRQPQTRPVVPRPQRRRSRPDVGAPQRPSPPRRTPRQERGRVRRPPAPPSGHQTPRHLRRARPARTRESSPAISTLTAHRQAARSAARCVNGGSLPSTSTSGRPDACMTGHGAGTAGRVPFYAAPCQVRPRPDRRAERAHRAGTVSNEKKDRRAPLSLS